MRILLPAALALASLPLCAAEKDAAPAGRSMQQRFNSSMAEQQSLVFDTRSGAAGNGQSFNAGAIQSKGFQFNQRFAPTKYQAAEFAPAKKSWFGNFKFFSKSAELRSKGTIPNADTAAPLKSAPIKSAPTRQARDAGKTARVNDLPDGDRTYLGRESEKFGQHVDPKSMANWREGGETVAGEVGKDKTIERFSTMKPLTVEDVREILNKNK